MTTVEMILGAGIAVMGGGNVWNWLASRGKTRVDLIALAEKIAAATITALDSRIKELEDKVDVLSRHVETLEGVIRELGAIPPPRPSRKINP
jgi:hypothetical protein